MCSATQRVAAIEMAIDDLAARALTVPESDRATGEATTDRATTETAAELLVRLAELWEWLADLNPDVASRLPKYRT